MGFALRLLMQFLTLLCRESLGGRKMQNGKVKWFNNEKVMGLLKLKVETMYLFTSQQFKVRV